MSWGYPLTTPTLALKSLDLQLHLHRGIGQDHAKFSPVATASYRILPDIIIKEPIVGDDAVKFKGCFADGVVGIDGM